VTCPEQPHGELFSGALARLFVVILVLPGRPFGARVRRILDAINSRFVICNSVLRTPERDVYYESAVTTRCFKELAPLLSS
jgi:hypothetical protein